MAIVLIVLLSAIFLLLEAGRVMWAWVTVQSAARDGARYAITGQDRCEPGYDRLDCVITTTYKALSTLPLNRHPDAVYEDDNYYLIEVFGVDQTGQLVPGYPGDPGQPVVVRVTYRVPIITPLFRPIRQSLPVFGQVV
ncbi:MAG TPA: TadE family protein, partial [Candidatus Binatia bacterium]|nr:TadE family protein [Candidatus Binatia bacterium]